MKKIMTMISFCTSLLLLAACSTTGEKHYSSKDDSSSTTTESTSQKNVYLTSIDPGKIYIDINFASPVEDFAIKYAD